MMKNALVFLAAIAPLATQAVDICAWSNAQGCSGTGVCCNNIGANNCCGIPGGFGFSIGYNGLPGPVSDGQAWTSNNCVAGGIVTFQIGTGNKCWVGGGLQAHSMAWTHAASKRELGNGTTVNPDVFKFIVGGETKGIKIPDNVEIGDLVALANAGDFATLQTYEAA
jgi:hypothetical protein